MPGSADEISSRPIRLFPRHGRFFKQAVVVHIIQNFYLIFRHGAGLHGSAVDDRKLDGVMLISLFSNGCSFS